MQGLLEQRNRRVVSGGQFNGLVFSELDQSQLKKAARRYPSDAKLQKFAKAKLAILEIEGGSEPLPCVPVRPQPAGAIKDRSWKIFCLDACKHLGRAVINNRWLRVLTVIACLMMLLKPPFYSILVKYVVRTFRLFVRRFLDLMVMILEGFLDELIYQLDKLIKETLPAEVSLAELPGTALHLISHDFSALVGVSFSLIASYMQSRRGQVA